MRTETIKKREPYAVFTDKLADYVITTMKHGSDVEGCIRHLVDPMEGFKEKYEPPPLLDPNPPFNVRFMLEERLKACVKREFELHDNIIKVYGMLWMQCSSALQAVVK